MAIRDLHLQSVRLARSLQFDGVMEGDIIGLCSENRAEFPVVLFAAFLLGATVAPLNTTYIEGMYKKSLIIRNYYTDRYQSLFAKIKNQKNNTDDGSADPYASIYDHLALHVCLCYAHTNVSGCVHIKNFR